MSKVGKCPIWGTDAKIGCYPTTDGDNVVTHSPHAGGGYRFPQHFWPILEVRLREIDVSDKVKLTSWLVEQRRLGDHHPRITQDILDDLTKMRPPSVHDRMDALLRYLDEKTDLIDEWAAVDYSSKSDCPILGEVLAWTASQSGNEVKVLVQYCCEQDWVEQQGDPPISLRLKPSGYARLAELDSVKPMSSQAFIAMWFDDSMNDAYEKGIKPAIKETGYDPQRIDDQEFTGKIDDQIVAEIRRSRFLVADFTQGASGARGGVYYEAGFARGLKIEVISTCRKDVIDKVHFDTRQYNHIIWETPKDLKKRLVNCIAAVIGDGPLKKPK